MYGIDLSSLINEHVLKNKKETSNRRCDGV